MPCGTVLQLIRRDPDPKPLFASFHHLYDIDGPHMQEGGKAVDEAHGFFVVSAADSILFYSGGMYMILLSHLLLLDWYG